MPPRTAALVLGMHRSGTSCLAGSLEARGLDLGEVSRSDPHNAKGNHEDLGIRELNEAVLEYSGGAWDAPPDAVAWNLELRTQRDALIARKTLAGGGLWGFKDPRTLVLLPFWLAALRQPVLVGTFRHPLLVARSLEARGGMPLAKGLALWSVYNERLLALRRDRRFRILRFDVGAARYRRDVDTLAVSLGLSWESLDEDFRDESLVHQSRNSEPLDPQLAAQLAELDSYAGT